MSPESLAFVLARCESRAELEVWDAAFSSAIALPRAARDVLRQARVAVETRLARHEGPACRAYQPGLPRGGCFGDGEARCAGCRHYEGG